MRGEIFVQFPISGTCSIPFLCFTTVLLLCNFRYLEEFELERGPSQRVSKKCAFLTEMCYSLVVKRPLLQKAPICQMLARVAEFGHRTVAQMRSGPKKAGVRGKQICRRENKNGRGLKSMYPKLERATRHW